MSHRCMLLLTAIHARGIAGPTNTDAMARRLLFMTYYAVNSMAGGWHNSLIEPAGIGPTCQLLKGDIMNTRPSQDSPAGRQGAILHAEGSSPQNGAYSKQHRSGPNCSSCTLLQNLLCFIASGYAEAASTLI